MKTENPAALRFIIDDDLYLLNSDKISTDAAATVLPDPTPKLIYTPKPIAADLTPQPAEIPEPIAANSTSTETALPVFKYLGSNKKHFLIVVHYTDAEFIDNAHLTALQNILKRKELELDDVAIFNLAPYTNATHNLLTDFFKPEKLLVMGKNALPVNIAPLVINQPKQLDNLMALYSFSFDEMMSSNDHKKAFWDQMKNL